MTRTVILPLGCPIPLSNDPNRVLLPENRSSDSIVKNLTYIMEDEDIISNESQLFLLFGGHQNWQQRDNSFKLNSSMKVQLSTSIWLLYH